MLKIIITISLFFSSLLFSAEIDSKLKEFVKLHPQEIVKVWIFFTDKGPNNNASLQKANDLISERALKRRAKVKEENLVGFSDYPVYQGYLEQITPYLIKLRKKSRWLNAVSAEIICFDIEKVAQQSFVKEIRIMRTFKKIENPQLKLNPVLKTFNKKSVLEYGNSLGQLNQINIPLLHDKNLSGNGVVIGMLDDGYNLYKTHVCFDTLEVLATWDFVNDDSTVDDPGAIVNKGEHGTYTLSTIAGYSPGHLIGPAYGAGYLLAKTEIDPGESQVEEDNWVAGLEWAEANGADIVSSSVGYGYYASGDPPQSQWWYDWPDMDGQTAVTTLATITAEENGLIVVNSAGNEGYNADHNTLAAPADGEFVVTVGGVTSDGNRVSSSSVGPTADGRIKPDIMAAGSTVFVASPFNENNYATVSGTSFSAPLVAGGIALLLEAFPNLTPQQVREALYNTASKTANPDNLYGYGIADFNAAYNYILDTTSSGGDNPFKPVNFVLSQNYPNPFNGQTLIKYSVKNPSRVTMRIFDSTGKEVALFPAKVILSDGAQMVSGEQLGASGIYFYQTEAKELNSGRKSTQIHKMVYLK